MLSRLFGLWFCTLYLSGVAAINLKKWFKDDFKHFVTEPNIRTYKVHLIDRVEDDSLLQPGYIFYAPFSKLDRQNVGPHILDQNGELVWWGNDSTKGRVQNFHVCDDSGSTGRHLCWSETSRSVFKVQGTNRIFDETYKQVAGTFHAAYPLTNPNPHEFNMVSGSETFLQSVYQLRPYDLTPYHGIPNGFVFDGCFQEVDVVTGRAIFSWCGLDHLPIWHTKIFLHIPENKENWTGEAYGQGTADKPWDYFHINAVDKTHEGDYLLSARHLDQIIKVAGNDNVHGVDPGTILWRLGGTSNEFESEAETIDLSRQHHVRHIKTTATETTFSLFNNQWKHHNPRQRISNVQIITINNDTMTVTSTKKFYNPESQLSLAQGSMQILPNGNIFVGWGTVPHISEFSPNGTLLYHMHLDQYFPEKGTHNMQNYRVFKHDWVGKPATIPKLVAYSQSCTTDTAAPLVAYVSWNGATEVRHWRFYRSSFLGSWGPWMFAGRFPKAGFETKTYLRGVFGGVASFAPAVKVQALDGRGNVLAESVTQTFVPGHELASNCSAEGCFKHEWFEYEATLSCGQSCPYGVSMFAIVAFVFILLVIVTFCWWMLARKMQVGRRWGVDLKHDEKEPLTNHLSNCKEGL